MTNLYDYATISLQETGLIELGSTCSSQQLPIIRSSNPSVDTSPTANSSSQTPAPADIVEIQRQPVSVQQLSTTEEIPAKEGMGLQFGETIRTKGEALAQIDLKSGLAFRIGGNAVLTLRPDNQLNLTAGNMITWVQPGQKVPTEIVTPAAIAGIRGTTVYVEIPKNPEEEILFFAWEGRVAVRLPNQTEELELKTGEEVKIRPGERDMKAIRQRVRRLSRAEWQKKLQSDRLLRTFKREMPTLTLIEKLKPGQVDLKTPVAEK